MPNGSELPPADERQDQEREVDRKASKPSAEAEEKELDLQESKGNTCREEKRFEPILSRETKKGEKLESRSNAEPQESDDPEEKQQSGQK